MALIRWQPFREVDSLQQEMNRLFESLVPTTQEDGVTFAPSAEMEELEKEIRLRVEIPGIDPKDVDVQITKDAVAISGERRTEEKTEENGMRRSEFRYGSFYRVIPLPSEVKNTEAQAEYKDGILRLNIPKSEEQSNKVHKVSLV